MTGSLAGITNIIIQVPLVVICCYYMIVQSIRIIENFKQNPYSSRVEFISEGKIKFPPIQVCPASWVDRLQQRRLNISDEFLEYMLEFLIDDLLVRKEYTPAESVELYEEFQNFKANHSDLEYPIGILDQLRLPCESLLDNCHWKGQSFNCCDPNVTAQAVTNVGPCFVIKVASFNGGFQQLEGPVDGLEFGIREQMSASTRPTYKYNRVPFSGGMVSVMNGFRPWTTQPQLVAMRSSTFIGLNRVESRRTYDCMDQIPTNHLSSSPTTRSACLYNCFQQETYRICNCYPGADPLFQTPKARVCDPWDYTSCFRSQIGPNTSKVIVFCDDKIKNQCPYNCVSNEYNPSTGVAPLSKDQAYGIDESDNSSYERSNVLVYFTIIGKTVVQQITTQTSYTILSNIGGLMGLWVGLSIFGLGQSISKMVIVPIVQKLFTSTRHLKKTKENILQGSANNENDLEIVCVVK